MHMFELIELFYIYRYFVTLNKELSVLQYVCIFTIKKTAFNQSINDFNYPYM